VAKHLSMQLWQGCILVGLFLCLSTPSAHAVLTRAPAAVDCSGYRATWNATTQKWRVSCAGNCSGGCSAKVVTCNGNQMTACTCGSASCPPDLCCQTVLNGSGNPDTYGDCQHCISAQTDCHLCPDVPPPAAPSTEQASCQLCVYPP
jgi:hypothetical protein